MRHYEIMLLIRPDLSDQVPSMISRYTQLIESQSGKIHRLEDLERLTLSYPIEKLPKAHYVLMNIECSQETQEELCENFKFNDAVMRNLVIKKSDAVTEPSLLMQMKKKNSHQPEEAVRVGNTQAHSADEKGSQTLDHADRDESSHSSEESTDAIDNSAI